MKTLNLILFMILFHLTALLAGCSLFRKTTKTTSTNKQETNKQTYLDRSSIQTTSKETNTYTWWKDSILYQFQNVKEQIDYAETSRLTAVQKAISKQEAVNKKSGPIKTWIYFGMGIAIFGCYVLYKKLTI